MRTETLHGVDIGANQISDRCPAAEAWAEQLAAVGLPQRYVFRLYVFVRIAGGGVPFSDIPAARRKVGMAFDVLRPIMGQISARPGDVLIVNPLSEALPLAVLRRQNGAWHQVQAPGMACIRLLRLLERGGDIRYQRAFFSSDAGALQ
ncbi:hypothetical protein [Gemmatimonas sp.]